jgi:hypothetical protein
VTIGGFPFALALAFGVASRLAAGADLPAFPMEVADSALTVLPWTLFGVAWHRLVLVAGSSAPSVSMTWSRSHTWFALFLLFWRVARVLTTGLLVLPDLPETPDPTTLPEIGSGVMVASLAWLGLMVVGLYLQARLSLFLPAVAIGQPLSLRQSWAQSRHYTGVIFWGVVFGMVLGLLVTSPLFAASLYLTDRPSAVAQLISTVLSGGSSIVVMALAVGSLSFAYRAIGERRALPLVL